MRKVGNLLHIFLRKYPQDFLFQNVRPVCLGKDQFEIVLNLTRNPLKGCVSDPISSGGRRRRQCLTEIRWVTPPRGKPFFSHFQTASGSQLSVPGPPPCLLWHKLDFQLHPREERVTLTLLLTVQIQSSVPDSRLWNSLWIRWKPITVIFCIPAV